MHTEEGVSVIACGIHVTVLSSRVIFWEREGPWSLGALGSQVPSLRALVLGQLPRASLGPKLLWGVIGLKGELRKGEAGPLGSFWKRHQGSRVGDYHQGWGSSKAHQKEALPWALKADSKSALIWIPFLLSFSQILGFSTWFFRTPGPQHMFLWYLKPPAPWPARTALPSPTPPLTLQSHLGSPRRENLLSQSLKCLALRSWPLTISPQMHTNKNINTKL